MSKKIEPKETLVDVVMTTIITFLKLTCAVVAIGIILQFVTGTPPEHNNPYDYQLEDN